MLNSIIIAVVAVSAVWVYLDATKNKIGKSPMGKACLICLPVLGVP